MKLFEFNMSDLYDYSDEEIDQGSGLFPTINRRATQNYIRDIANYDVSYVLDSYSSKGIFEFEIKGFRGEYYVDNDGYSRKIRQPSRRNKRVSHTVRIKPKSQLYSLDDLFSSDIDIFCTCNDFRYVFMDMAYKGLKPIYSKIREYGLVPVYQNQPNKDSRANIRNPKYKGALCKHSLLVIDRLIDNENFSLLDSIEKDILKTIDRIESGIPSQPLIKKDDLLDLEDKYYDSQGRLKHKSKIVKERDRKIDQIEEYIEDLKYSPDPLAQVRGVNSYDQLKTALLQPLLDFDGYYLQKSDIENINVIKYLPIDYESDYDYISNLIDELEVSEYQTPFKEPEFEIPEEPDIEDIFSEDDFASEIDDLLKESRFKYIQKFDSFV